MGDRNISPWHMWGSSQTLVAEQAVAGETAEAQPQQLSHIQYARPDTWRFFFAATLMRFQPAVPGELLSGDLNIAAGFDVTLGVGRSQIIIPNFRVFTFTNIIFLSPVPRRLYASNAPAPTDMAGGPLTITFGVPITDLCAESIQVVARMTLSVGASPPLARARVSVDMTSFLAPKTHIRPEWFGIEDKGFYGEGSTIPRFPGGEDKGA